MVIKTFSGVQIVVLMMFIIPIIILACYAQFRLFIVLIALITIGLFYRGIEIEDGQELEFEYREEDSDTKNEKTKGVE